MLEVRGVICSRRDRYSNWHSSWDNNWVIKEKTVQVPRGWKLICIRFSYRETHLFFTAAVFSPLLFILEGWVDTGIASLSSKSLLPCVRCMISKWFVERVLCVCWHCWFHFLGIRSSEGKHSQSKTVASKIKVYCFKSTFSAFGGGNTRHPAVF